ncbi:hypothetical protein [Portibacter lacus]|uniref:Uncharacterized protein n=1 Tax=Portibacter lacus TaxID=1099794 RepID=A0AA37WDA4_9BACT|nr:hypothetical protein [Portibacter lacus]GLR16618.1 hypothetical protein GCM10007940_12330 [Portibacter lacus]
MMKVYMFLSLFLLVNLCFQCDCDNDDLEDVSCFEFDQRQCAGDEWANEIPISDTEEVREQKMKTYLESKDIEVNSVNLVLNYHDGVCEACYICPEEHRFFVEINKEDQGKLEELDLLNLGFSDCGG